MIDYKEIIEQLKDEDVFRLMERLGAQPIDKQDYILCKTICHNIDADEASYKLYYYKDSHMFYCYTECGGMSIFKLLRNYYETRQIEYNWYNDIFQVVLNCSESSVLDSSHPQAYKSQRDEYSAQKVRKVLPAHPPGLLDIYTKYYPVEWLNDSISKESMDKFNIKFSVPQNKIIIPHYDVDDRLVGIRGRALNPQEIEQVGKYAPVWIEGKCYSHPLMFNLYGLNVNKENIKNMGIAFIAESEKSVMQAESFSIPNCVVASCGSNLNKYQIDLLIRTCAPREIVVCYDREELEGSDKYFNKLYNMCKKYTHYCKMSFIYDREKITPMKASPFDCGEEKFIKLYKRRVEVK